MEMVIAVEGVDIEKLSQFAEEIRILINEFKDNENPGIWVCDVNKVTGDGYIDEYMVLIDKRMLLERAGHKIDAYITMTLEHIGMLREFVTYYEGSEEEFKLIEFLRKYKDERSNFIKDIESSIFKLNEMLSEYYSSPYGTDHNINASEQDYYPDIFDIDNDHFVDLQETHIDDSNEMMDE